MIFVMKIVVSRERLVKLANHGVNDLPTWPVWSGSRPRGVYLPDFAASGTEPWAPTLLAPDWRSPYS